MDATLRECVKLRGDEHEVFPQLLRDIKNGPVRAVDLESKYGISVYNLLRKLVNSGMVEKTEQGYVLSTRFSQLLRSFADEWEEYVMGVID
ncbi:MULTISPECIES: helix-turn-helix domain-containing protein [unclassified Archaeoglobus]|jgi:predicted transcriptional regulator|uniref:helix-turn-helix domain-containing protein n=1 Tax=unclassified Archaeoglobus TaxID=2643606 RepID=UPI0025C2EFF9|nr:MULTISPECIES: helix-turn-helix domain-containing protein [unclassified Archaeoglobus]